MQKAPTATVSSGSVAPTIVGPEKDMKEIYVLSSLVLFLAAVVAGFWYFSQADEAAHSNRSTEGLNTAQVSQVLKSQPEVTPVGIPAPSVQVDHTLMASRSTDVLHDDIYFEIGRKGLTDDGRAALQRHAAFLMQEADWGVLVQGYTDQQGSASYNKILGQKRADSVKQQLMALGVPESSIRTVSLGEDGALCIDRSDACRRMNRRVHLELRKIGREHMVIPAAIAPATIEEQPADTEPALQAEDTAGTSDGLLTVTPSPSESLAPSADAPAADSTH